MPATIVPPRLDDFRNLQMDHEDALLWKSLIRFVLAAQALGYFVRTHSDGSLSQLNKVSKAHKIQSSHFLDLAAGWMEEAMGDNNENLEVTLLKNALNHYGLDIDEELLKTIDKETVVEMYNGDMVQIYRSLNMFKMTGYSLLDLVTFEWFVLWERPQLAIQQMHEDFNRVYQGQIPFKSAEVSVHILKETYDNGLTQPFYPRSCMVQFQHLGYLKSKIFRGHGALLCTAKGQVISTESKEIDKIVIL